MSTRRALPGITAKEGPHGIYFIRDPDASIYTEVKRIVDGELKITTCCCKGAGMTPRECAEVTGNKTPCRCDCHRAKPRRTRSNP